MKVLVIGNGGREHALAWKLAQSTRVAEVLVAPGNSGTAAEPKCRNVDVKATDLDGLLALVQREGVALEAVAAKARLHPELGPVHLQAPEAQQAAARRASLGKLGQHHRSSGRGGSARHRRCSRGHGHKRCRRYAERYCFCSVHCTTSMLWRSKPASQ